MLLSMFTSFLLARRFRINIFVPLITAVIVIISYFSVVLPFKEITGSGYPTPSHIPLPLSFPLYSIDKTEPEPPVLERDEVYFLNYRIIEYAHYYYHTRGISVHTRLRLFVHYFVLVNIVGAILGYGLSKAKSIWRYFARKKSEMGRVEVNDILLVAIVTILLLYVFSHSAIWSLFHAMDYYPVSYYFGLSVCIFSVGLIGLLMGYFLSKSMNAIYVEVGLVVYLFHIIYRFLGLDYVVAVFSMIMVLSVSLSYVGLIAKRPVLKLLPVAFFVGICLTLIFGLYQKRFLVHQGEFYDFGFPFVWLQAERGLSTRTWRYNFQSSLILDVFLYSAIMYSGMIFAIAIIDRLIVRKTDRATEA